MAAICSGVLPWPRTTSGKPVRRARWWSSSAKPMLSYGRSRNRESASSTETAPCWMDSSSSFSFVSSMVIPPCAARGAYGVFYHRPRLRAAPGGRRTLDAEVGDDEGAEGEPGYHERQGCPRLRSEE